MAKKIYDFLPGHLKNKELETIFETTLDRVFSVGEMEKTKAFVGRKEKGIYNSKDAYLSFPPTAYARDNYGLEPTFTNRDASDNIFYDDLLNSLYNKGALTNDHRRLFKSTLETIQLPIDLDKFVNYSMYYWVSPGFASNVSITAGKFVKNLAYTIATVGTTDYTVIGAANNNVGTVFTATGVGTGTGTATITITGSTKKHYATIDKGNGDVWSSNNSWYHYDDISSLITNSNFTLISQAIRPIIEFDKNLDLSDTSPASEIEFPTFKTYDSGNNYVSGSDKKIFHYVTNSNYKTDTELGFKPKVKSGDYHSEYVFNIDLPETDAFKVSADYKKLYTTSVFDYRNLRQEIGDKITVSEIELLQSPKNFNTIDLYVDGNKQVGNYTLDNATNKITMTEAVSGNIYVDYCTSTSVVYDGETIFQRINPAVEYNVDNKSYYNTEMPYSLVFEHFVRIIETVSGLTGSPIANNNYRNIGATTDKLRNANQGSILIKNTIDIKEAYFALTREDYNPIKATEFLAGAYNGYKNKLLTTIISILESSASTTKTDLEILEEAIDTISLGKHSSVSIFKDSTMLNFGDNFSHYQTLDVTVVNGAVTRPMPTFDETVTNKKDAVIILNGIIQRLNVDYTLNSGNTEITFTTALSTGDILSVRHYTNIKETFIPPSATSLQISPAYIPKIITDTEYDSPGVKFISGHDGSLIPAYSIVGEADHQIDRILLIFETLVFNNLTDNTSSKIDSMNYGLYSSSGVDYSNNEKKYIMYPFFKKWMTRNNIENLNNDFYKSTGADAYKTWNYRAKNDASAGHWRGQLIQAYGTDRPLQEPWKAIKLSQKPANFDSTYGADYTLVAFWNSLINTNSLTCPIPVVGGNLKEPNDLFFGSAITSDDIALMDQAWEFGDNSPVELAWTRSSEFAFAEFMLMVLSNPFKVVYEYTTQITNIITYSNKNEGIDTSLVVAEKVDYEFKLGSKLGGFVNNFKLQSENNSLSNSRFTELPADNYDLVVHAGVPNRSEFFSAIVLEKVSLDLAHPVYALADVSTYYKGLVALNSSDGKYYKRKIDGVSAKETAAAITFDYSSWTLISQPKTNKFGFRVHGYDEINPVFYSMGWDKASGEKAFTTAGEKLTLQQWQPGEYYRLDTYVLFNDIPYICLKNHTATSLFDDNSKDWKAVTEWPTTNKVQALGYKELVNDTVKNYNYGDILNSVDDVAHLIMGYEHYLQLVGWNFTNTDEFGDIINWENLLLKFLEWQSEVHEIGDFITLTPLLTGGSFDATYGVASVASETFKNYYRVVDASGRLIPTSELTFHTDGATISFASNVPVYGMKIDIRDIEHAFIVDRTDSYGDVIYDPHLHNRNLRMQIDCNRTIGWDGTMSVDGYLVNENKLLPNFDTMIEETRYYRDTLVDQGLSVINKLKANHYGYTTRPYLSNSGVERESQLEFYKGFLSHKGTDSSINKIVNNNGNFKNITHDDIWAIKLSDYGHSSSNLKMTKDVNVEDMISDPYLIEYTSNDTLKYDTTKTDIAIKTTGYVDADDVNYVTSTHSSLTDFTGTSLYEGDTTWIQFDTDREWDVVRLSEVAEISYIGETADNQLYIGVVSQIDSADNDKSIYLKIKNTNVSPSIDGYYLLIANGTKTVNSTIVYEYLVFEEDFEPLIVEIDSLTTNSVFVPTNADSGVEAIGSVSNPTISTGEILVIDGTSFTYTPTAASASGITILGTVANPVVSEGEQASFVVYNSGGTVENGTNTRVTFSGTVATTTGSFTSTVGDQITIDGNTLTVDYAGTQSITTTSTATRTSPLTTGNTVVIDSVSKSVADLSVTGTAYTGTTSSAEYLMINGTQVEVASGSTSTNIVDIINSSAVPVSASESSNVITITTSEPSLVIAGSFLNDLGLSSTGSVKEYKLDNLATELNTLSNITAIVSGSNLVISSSSTQMIISGTALVELGITAGTYLANSDPTINSVVDQINALNILGVTASVVTGTIKVSSTNHDLDIVEVTSGAMSRLGYATTTVTIDGTDTIVSDLNTQVFQGSTIVASKSDRQVLITSSESSIVAANITGNSLSDIGITVGTYSNTSILSSSAVDFASYITSQSTIAAKVSSDGRMIFTNSTVNMSFSGTTQAMLTKIGLSLEYSNITSNANFKAMLWKSIRYTPDFNGTSFTEFTTALGLNSKSKLWVDNYDADGWAVLSFDSGVYTIHAKQSKTINTDLTRRVIIKDGENFTNHQLYDPLNLKMPGQIVSNLDYVTWNDPASYDTITSSDIWLDEKLGKIWWDTGLARFYRYNDYGDANGNLNVNYVKKYWGKLVKESEVSVKKWIKTRILPDGTTSFNTKKYYDEVANKEVTDYFYWSSNSDDCDEIAMLINSEGPKNKFLPVGTSSVIISNNTTLYDNATISTTLEYQLEIAIRKENTDWELLSNSSDYVIPKNFLNDMTESISNTTILKTYATKLIASQLTDVSYAYVRVDWISALTTDDIVVTTDSKTVKASYLSIESGTETAGTFVVDKEYQIITVGTTDYTLIGANNNTLGTVFTATGVGTGTGTASYSNLKISKSHTMVENDVLRVYKVQATADNWFSNSTNARNNFASIINNTMSNKMLTTLYSNYAQYLDTDDIIFSLGDWYLNANYKTINSFSYLSTTKNFDMIAEYNKGIKSFKIKLPSTNEYYFEVDNTLQLVNKSNSTLNVSFNSLVYPETGYDTYYANAVGIQIHELMNMIEDYPDVSFINDIFFTMIKYLYTEKTYPMWLFKTSYIDLNLYNRDLKQYAVYQRDSEEDVLEYVREAKPYHTKIREIKRMYETADTMNATTTIDENMNITLDFGNNSRYDETLYDGNAATDITDGDYEQGSLLRTRYVTTAGTTGFDTGEVTLRGLESPVLRLQTYTGDITGGIGSETIDKTVFYVYDVLGRGYSIDVTGKGTISSFNGTTVVIGANVSQFGDATDTNKKLIAVEKAGTSNIEFMLYDNKSSSSLTISDRVLYTGLGHTFANNDVIYALDVPLQLVRNNDEGLENLL
jgi:hypothetical protein